MKLLIHSQASLHCWSLEMDKRFNSTLYNECDYLSMLQSVLVKGAPGVISQTTILLTVTSGSPSSQLVIHVSMVRQRISWWHYGMKKLSIILDLCMGNPLVTGGFPSNHKGPLMGKLWCICSVFSLNKLLNKLLSYQWFDMPWDSCVVTVLWHCHPNKHIFPCFPGRYTVKSLI